MMRRMIVETQAQRKKSLARYLKEFWEKQKRGQIIHICFSVAHETEIKNTPSMVVPRKVLSGFQTITLEVRIFKKGMEGKDYV